VAYRVACPDRSVRTGFAAPLAIVMLIAVALLALLMIEGALGELRTGSAVASEARIAGKAETALAALLATTFDTGVVSLPAGTVVLDETTGGADSIRSVIQLVGGRVARVLVRAHSATPGIRGFAGRQVFVKLRPNPAAPAELVLEPLAGNWWVMSP
jgi:hypothetical protein